jgi:hypothetical protein
MRYVIVPSDVHIVDRQGRPVEIKINDQQQPWIIKHEDFVFENITSNEKLVVGGGEGVRRQRKIRKAFEECKVGDIIGIEDADFKIARFVLDNLVWHSQFARYAEQMLPHIEAWENADRQNDEWKKKQALVSV